MYDLRVSVESIGGTCTCNHQVGDAFELRGGQLSLPGPNTSFCLYALQSTLPLLPAKQRPLQPADWMQTDTRVVCPDPLCGVVMHIERMDSHRVRHADVSAVPLPLTPGGPD
ncbi:MAG: TIGR04076 family protein [Chloroflexi bacterium]|nr:TIGR04076 family protein [Chloroflexota bacterium]